MYVYIQVMLRGTQVSFPAAPPPPLSSNSSGSSAAAGSAVSEEAKAFMRACLTLNQSDRPDVSQLCSHPYLSRAAGK
jgi:hypothetical protein